MDELVRMKWACFIQEVVQVRLHLIQVLVFRVPYFGGQLGGDRPFLHTFLLVVFQGPLHQLVHGLGWWWWWWVFCSGQGLQGHHYFTGRGLCGLHV